MSNSNRLLKEIVAVLDAELNLDAFDDDSHNGLQVANSGKVSRIACGVDASLEFLHAARNQGADLCIVHHGLSWGLSLAHITETNYDIVSFLIQNDIALYGVHLPLDAHMTLGNNAQLAQALNLTGYTPFCQYHGSDIGVQGAFLSPISFDTLCDHVRAITPAGAFHALPFGKSTISTIGIVSGGAASDVTQAAAASLDCYLTGEMNLQAYNAAKMLGINMIAAGHYATERFGVKALGQFIESKFKIPTNFINFDLPW